MTFLQNITAQLPMEKINDFWSMAKGKLPASMTKDYPDIETAKKIIKRVDYLLAEKAILKLGKQTIFTREIKNEDGTSKMCAYEVDFDNKDHIKRLRTFLTELIDLTEDDASGAKKASVSGYLDYIAVSQI